MSASLRNSFIVSNNQLGTQAVTVSKMAYEGNATQVLTSNGNATYPTYQAIPTTTGDVVNLGTTSLGVAGTTLTSSAITDGVYRGFLVQYNLLDNGSGNSGIGMILNSDTGANQYISNTMQRNNTTIASANRSLAYFEIQGVSNPSANYSINGYIIINNPTPAVNRTMHNEALTTANTPSIAEAITTDGMWKSTAGITSIALKGANNWAVGSNMTIWGFKK